MEQVHKLVKEAQEATTNANIPSNLADYGTAMRDRMELLRQYVNDNSGLDPIPAFDPLPA